MHWPEMWGFVRFEGHRTEIEIPDQPAGQETGRPAVAAKRPSADLSDSAHRLDYLTRTIFLVLTKVRRRFCTGRPRRQVRRIKAHRMLAGGHDAVDKRRNLLASTLYTFSCTRAPFGRLYSIVVAGLKGLG